jgi:hypothetical protein
LCAEVGDFAGFRKPAQLMSYLGLVPFRDQHRPAAQARVDHQDRLQARPSAADRGRLALPQTPADRHHAHRTTSRPAARSHRDRPVRAAAPVPHLDTTETTQQTPHPDRRRRRPRTRRTLLGDLPDRVTHRQPPNNIPSAGSVAARHARGTRDTPLSNQPPAGHARPKTAAPHDEPWSCEPTPGNLRISVRPASRTANRTATHPA